MHENLVMIPSWFVPTYTLVYDETARVMQPVCFDTCSNLVESIIWSSRIDFGWLRGWRQPDGTVRYKMSQSVYLWLRNFWFERLNRIREGYLVSKLRYNLGCSQKFKSKRPDVLFSNIQRWNYWFHPWMRKFLRNLVYILTLVYIQDIFFVLVLRSCGTAFRLFSNIYSPLPIWLKRVYYFLHL